MRNVRNHELLQNFVEIAENLFVRIKCVEMHSEWDEFSNHEMVSMEQVQSNVKQLVPSKKEVTLYCSLHEGMKLDLYCEICGELICLHCTVNKHCR